MEHARLISIAQKVVHTFGKDRQLPLCCTVYSRARSITLRPGQSARSIRGRGVIKEYGSLVLVVVQISESFGLVNVYIFNGAYSMFYLMHHKLMNIIKYGFRLARVQIKGI